jgi:hypothetical protein
MLPLRKTITIRRETIEAAPTGGKEAAANDSHLLLFRRSNEIQ